MSSVVLLPMNVQECLQRVDQRADLVRTLRMA